MSETNGATPVPVESMNNRLPGSSASFTNVPVVLGRSKISSPTWIFCRRSVKGPPGTLIEKNSKLSSQAGLAME